jgi:hypothetical protein
MLLNVNINWVIRGLFVIEYNNFFSHIISVNYYLPYFRDKNNFTKNIPLLFYILVKWLKDEILIFLGLYFTQ